MFSSVLAFSQPTNKRIEDILNPKKTEIEIEKEKLRSRLNSEAELTNTCIDKLFEAKREIDSLNQQLDSLIAFKNIQIAKLQEARNKQKTAEETLKPETNRKRLFAKIAIGEGAIIAGGIVGLATGAWVPVCIAVGVIELYLLVEGKVQINIKQTKI